MRLQAGAPSRYHPCGELHGDDVPMPGQAEGRQVSGVSGLAVWSGESRTWVSRPADEITWLDRNLMSGGEDRSLHRPPRCPAFRYVHHRWELFSRDVTHTVYVAPYIPGSTPDHRAVEAAAQYVLPAAQVALEARPVRLDAGIWLI